MKEKNLGFIGFGEAARAIIAGLKEEGYNKLRVYSHHQPGSSGYERYKGQAEELEVPLYIGLEEFREGIEVLFSLVPTSAALSTAENVIPYLPPEVIYIDLTASSPEIMKKIDQFAKNKGVIFADGAIMGSVPGFRHKVPIFLSGENILEIKDYFNKWGMELEFIGEEAGKASAIKLCRSIYTKGTQALLMELIDTTDKFNITDIILDSIDNTYYLEGFRKEAERLIKSTVKHARRKADELENIIQVIDNAGGINNMSHAAKRTLELISSRKNK